MSHPKQSLKLWIKFRPEHQQNDRGTAVLKSGPLNDREAQRTVGRFKRLLKTRYRGLYWQARIYDCRTNEIIYQENEPYETPLNQAG